MALCKTIEKKNIDTNQIRAEASALAANLAGQAGRARVKGPVSCRTRSVASSHEHPDGCPLER